MKLSQSFIKTFREVGKEETAHNAQLLIRAGYIHKEMAGVYDFLPLGLITLNKIQNINIKTDLISLYIVQGIEKLMKEFNVSEDADFYKVVRINSLDDEVLNYSTSFFDRKIVPFLNEEIAKNSIYEYLENELDLKISHSRREIKFRYATSEEKEHMDLKNYEMVVVIETYAYLSNGSLFEYGTISYRPDKFTFSTALK